MANTLWCGAGDDRLYLQSGQFTSTIKTSVSVVSVDNAPVGISYDKTDTPWTGQEAMKLYLTSGQFTSTVKTSESIASVDAQPTDVSYGEANTPWCGAGDDKLYLQSGQFTSTVKTSEYVGGTDITPAGISYDGTNTPWCGQSDIKLYLQSGQFTSTLKTSQDISGIDLGLRGISFDGTDTPWCGLTDDKLYLQSGQFTSTLKASEYVGSVDAAPTGIDIDDVDARLGIAPTVVTPDTLTLTATVETPGLAGVPVNVVISAALAVTTSQEILSLTTDGSVTLTTLALLAQEESTTIIAGADLSVSVLPLSLGMIMDEPPPTILGNVTLLLPGVPMIILGTALSLHAPEVSVTNDIKIVVTNARTFAISEYISMAYNSMAKFNGKYLYAKADGIYEGGGDNDNGADIAAGYKTGTFNINATEVQKLRNLWMNYRSDGDINFFSVGNEINTRWYPFVNSTNGTIHERRQKFERGIRDNHFSFGISNVSGSSFEIKTAKILTEPIRKRR